MEAVSFKTASNNYYLYSPAQKVVLPIPQSLYEDLEHGTDSCHVLHTILERKGYFEEYKARFSGRISVKEVENALLNVSQIVFETTTSCNLKCEYCCYGEGYTTFNNRRTGNLDFGKAKSVLDYFSYLLEKEDDIVITPEPFAVSFYGGEPLMNFSVIKEIVDYAERIRFRGKELVFTMTTNAVLLRKYADFLSRHNFHILVSLDGDKTHDSYRKTCAGKESFDIVYDNLKFVETHYSHLFAAIHFNSVYTDKSDAGEIIKFFRSEFGKVPKFSLLHDPETNAREADKIKLMYKSLEIPMDVCMQEELVMESPIHKRIFELCVKLSKYSYHDESQLLDVNSKVRYPTGTCIPFSKRIFVSYNGELHPCEKINRNIPWGKVDARNNVIINLSYIVERFNKMLDRHERMCSACYLQQCCTKCAFQSTAEVCKSMVSKEQFRTILSQTYSYIEEHPNIVNLLKDNVIVK